MNYRSLGSTDIRVSVLGLGTVKLGRSEQVKYPRPFQVPDDAHAERLLACAAGLGVNLLDTAPAYGESEARLGRLLADRRADWVICTKVGEEFESGRSRYDFSADHVRRSVHRSLERLNTDYLDVVLIHSDGNDLDVLDRTDALETLIGLKAAGWIRAVGISHKTEAGGRRALDLGCDVIMATLDAADRRESELIRAAGGLGRGVLVKKALGGGRAGLDRLGFAAAHPGVSSVMVGTIDPAHLRADVAAVAGIGGV